MSWLSEGIFFELPTDLWDTYISFFQVEHMLNDRLLQFVNLDLHEVKV